MPYIKQGDRKQYGPLIAELSTVLQDEGPQAGHFNYVITYLINDWFQNDRRYKTANQIIGVLECIKQEFYRREVAPYEDEKIKQNGDV